MRKGLSIFFQSVVVVLGIAVLGFLLWEPHLEGRNVNSTIFEIYFNDPFLAFVYVGSIAFFVALYQAFKILGYYGQDRFYSPASKKALQVIKYCALVIIGFALVGEIYIVTAIKDDDRAGGIMMGAIVILGSALVAAAATVLQRFLKEDLTV